MPTGAAGRVCSVGWVLSSSPLDLEGCLDRDCERDLTGGGTGLESPSLGLEREESLPRLELPLLLEELLG